MKEKILALLTPLLLCLVPGCKDQPAGPSPGSVLSGKIESWTPTYGNKVYAQAGGLDVDSSSVSAFGTFAFQQPFATPPAAKLWPFIGERSFSIPSSKLEDTRAFSNPNARYIELRLFLPNPLAGNDPRFTKFIPLYSGNSNITTDYVVSLGDYSVQYFYFSEGTSITGRHAAFYYDSSLVRQMTRDSVITDYNIMVPAGWSAITLRLVEDDGHVRRYQVAVGDVADKKWFIPLFGSLVLPGAKSLWN